MDNLIIKNLVQNLEILLQKHKEKETLESYYAVCEQLNMIGNMSEELVIEYMEVE